MIRQVEVNFVMSMARYLGKRIVSVMTTGSGFPLPVGVEATRTQSDR